MDPRISALEIENFRSLQHLKIEGLGRVNLITGRNNTGKSSVLEALHLFTSDASPSVISRILRYREEFVDESATGTRLAEGVDFSIVSSLFSGFPPLEEIRAPIVISANGLGHPQRVSLSVVQVAEERLADGTRRLILKNDEALAETESQPALMVESETRRRYLTPGILRRYLIQPSYAGDLPERVRLPCVYISPYGSEHTSALGPLWDNVALSDQEQDVVEALRIITPEIAAVSMIGGETPRRSRIAIARSSRFLRPVPLRSFGDGLNRIFGIILSLVNAKDGLLLIDEVENGMHHSVQLDLWRVIFRLSRRLNIQVFATSHSWDSVEAFQKAAKDDPDDGVLIRLSRRGEDIVPTVVSEDDLAIAMRDRIEVR
jgi:AAA domain, putative AbiEii toxin, Type IV TA system/AAA ATPase domain